MPMRYYQTNHSILEYALMRSLLLKDLSSILLRSDMGIFVSSSHSIESH